MRRIDILENGNRIMCFTCKKCGDECNSNPGNSAATCADYDPKMGISDQLVFMKAKILAKETSEDKVNHPSHYTQGGIECLDAIEAAMKPDQFRGYLKGNIIKYLWRYEWKNGLEDLKKAQFYMNRMVESMEKEISTKEGDKNASAN